jgi:hypothetical protein
LNPTAIDTLSDKQSLKAVALNAAWRSDKLASAVHSVLLGYRDNRFLSMMMMDDDITPSTTWKAG